MEFCSVFLAPSLLVWGWVHEGQDDHNVMTYAVWGSSVNYVSVVKQNPNSRSRSLADSFLSKPDLRTVARRKVVLAPFQCYVRNPQHFFALVHEKTNIIESGFGD